MYKRNIKFLLKYDIIKIAFILEMILNYLNSTDISEAVKKFEELNDSNSLCNKQEFLHIFEHIEAYTTGKRGKYDIENSNYSGGSFANDVKNSRLIDTYEKIINIITEPVELYVNKKYSETGLNEKKLKRIAENFLENKVLMSMLETNSCKNKLYSLSEAIFMVEAMLCTKINFKTNALRTEKYLSNKLSTETNTYIELVSISTECLNMLLEVLPTLCFSDNFKKTPFLKIQNFYNDNKDKFAKKLTTEATFEKFLNYEIDDFDDIRDAIISLYEIANMVQIIDAIDIFDK